MDIENNCVVCEELASYRPQFNKVLCTQHFTELVTERVVHLYTAKNIETIATEMVRQHQVILSKQKIFEIIKASVEKSLTELGMD